MTHDSVSFEELKQSGDSLLELLLTPPPCGWNYWQSPVILPRGR